MTQAEGGERFCFSFTRLDFIKISFFFWSIGIIINLNGRLAGPDPGAEEYIKRHYSTKLTFMIYCEKPRDHKGGPERVFGIMKFRRGNEAWKSDWVIWEHQHVDYRAQLNINQSFYINKRNWMFFTLDAVRQSHP